MAQILKDMSTNSAAQSLSFDEQMGLLIDTEWDFRQNHKSQLLNKKAGFTESNACIEGIDYRPDRNIEKPLIYKLSTCDFIKAHNDVLILGKTGVGKSYIAQALGNCACRNHISTRYVVFADLLDELSVAADAGRINTELDTWIKPLFLIVDDWFLTQPNNQDVERLLKLVEKRMHIGSTVYCSQLHPEEWHDRIEEKIIADAILDRIVNRSYLLSLEGESMRKDLVPAI
jgi:DNA replication protein DnaC